MKTDKLNWPKSKQGCQRQIDAILRSYQRDFAGGGAFGFDWPTFRANSPGRYARVRELQKLFVELPFRDGTRLPR
jgi:hypothetical protein